MPTTPPSITALPTPPDPNDRTTFNTRAYPWSVAQQTLATEVGAVATNVFDNATDAAASAVAAAAQAVLAETSADDADTARLAAEAAQAAAEAAVATIPEGTINDATTSLVSVWSSSKVAAEIAAIPTGTSLIRSARTSNTVLGVADKGTLIDITSGTFSQTFEAAATLGDGWYCYLRNSGTGVVTLDPNAAETIDGVATKALDPGQAVTVQCDGVALRTVVPGGVGNHVVIVHTGNGRGSTNTCIRRFTTTLTNVGTAITYADSATLGATFTINEAGLYAIQAREVLVASAGVGVSVNSTQLTTAIGSINVANRLSFVVAQAADTIGESTVVARLAAGDVVRHHVTSSNNTTDAVSFSIRKVGL